VTIIDVLIWSNSFPSDHVISDKLDALKKSLAVLTVALDSHVS
jgi:hypothetical protein